MPGTCCGRQCQRRAEGQAKGGVLFLKNKFSRVGRGPQDFGKRDGGGNLPAIFRSGLERLAGK